MNFDVRIIWCQLIIKSAMKDLTLLAFYSDGGINVNKQQAISESSRYGMCFRVSIQSEF